MTIRFGILTRLSIIMFLGIAILRMWFDIPYAIAVIPLFIEWAAIPIVLTAYHYIADIMDTMDARYYGSSNTIHWNYKTGSMYEDEEIANVANEES